MRRRIGQDLPGNLVYSMINSTIVHGYILSLTILEDPVNIVHITRNQYMQKTLSWHRYIVDTRILPTRLFKQLKQQVLGRSVLWDSDPKGNIIVNVLDDDRWSTWFAVTYSDYIIECRRGETVFQVDERPAVR